ncbi:ABC transporter ATP-binding protein [Devosia sp.]|uniref:ABC transporter ATP-binding protein n=1 Tax=Devosia sp. TaxID=1871048 RepID=UPI0019DDE20B|nr:ABC transporter ATP-binding protein [Devosia sp.]MBE0580195.1 ABC transporter ATP-binding protein [Devosia sp.]
MPFLGHLRRLAFGWIDGLLQTIHNARLTFRLSRSNWSMMAGFIVLALLNALTDSFSVMLIVPLLQSFSVDSVFGGVPFLEQIGALLQPLDPTSRLRWVALLILFILVAKGILQYLLDVIVYIMPLRVERDLRIRAFMAIMESRLSFAESLTSGETGNFTASFPARAGIAARFLMQLIAAVMTIVLILGLLLAITPTALMGLAAFAIVASALFRAITGPLSRRLDTQLTESQERFTQAYFEAVNNKRTIRIFNATEIFLGRIRKLLETLRTVQAQTIAVQNATYPFFSVLAGLLVCLAVLVASFYQPETSQSLLGILLVFLVAATRLLGPFSILHIANMHFAIHSEAVVQMTRFLDQAAANVDTDGVLPLPSDRPRIEFRDVSFAYPGSETGVRDLSLTINPSEFVAIVGPSGAGKSTIFHLISRLHRPSSGQILIDDVPLDDLAVRNWWDCISIVSQDVPIFNATVRDNIQFGVDEEPDDRRIMEALALASADEFVSRMPDGLETRLGEFGSVLSGGERQRLALARAFYHRKPIVMLDEVTSQLDAITEQRVAESIRRLHADGCTIIAIAHRYSTVRQADRLLVLDKGQLVDAGTPGDLTQRNEFVQAMAHGTA